jgi:hypothetical protein
LVNNSVGSFPGTNGELATTWWPRSLKNARKSSRSSLVVINFIKEILRATAGYSTAA